MLDDNMDRFAFALEDISPGDFTGEPMQINLNSDQAIFRPPHELGQVEWDFVEAQCKKLEALGFIQRSTQSTYASATVVVHKKDEDGNYTDFRQCGDYRPLNLETTLDRYPLPGIEDIFNQMGGGTNPSSLRHPQLCGRNQGNGHCRPLPVQNSRGSLAKGSRGSSGCAARIKTKSWVSSKP